MRTIFPLEIEGSLEICTGFAQNQGRPADRRVKFTVTIKHRASKGKVYTPAKNFPYYRLGFAVAGKRRMQTFATYTEARAAGERIVLELAQGSPADSLRQPIPRRPCRAGTLGRLPPVHGPQVLLAGGRFRICGSRWQVARAVAGGGEAVAGYLRTVVTVQRKDLGEAVTEFLAGSEHLTHAANGQPAPAPHHQTWQRAAAHGAHRTGLALGQVAAGLQTGEEMVAGGGPRESDQGS